MAMRNSRTKKSDIEAWIAIATDHSHTKAARAKALLDFCAYLRWSGNEKHRFVCSEIMMARYVIDTHIDISHQEVQQYAHPRRLVELLLKNHLYYTELGFDDLQEGQQMASMVRFLLTQFPNSISPSVGSYIFAINRRSVFGARAISETGFRNILRDQKYSCVFHFVNNFLFNRQLDIFPNTAAIAPAVNALLDGNQLEAFFGTCKTTIERLKSVPDRRAFDMHKFPSLPSSVVAKDFRLAQPTSALLRTLSRIYEFEDFL